MPGIEVQIICVLAWLALIKCLQVSVLPVFKDVFGRVSYGISFPAAVLLFTAVSWYCGCAGLPIALALVPFAVMAGYFLYHGRYHSLDLRESLNWDLIFIICFLFVLALMFINPTISFAEKFMDHAFVASIMRHPVVPPLDPWYAGGYLDIYYYLGYWMAAAAGIVTGTPSRVVFNLILPTAFALAAVCMYVIGDLILPRFRWLPLGVFFLVNPSFICHLLTGGGLYTALWGSTRTIAGTINEFPLFSMIWGDPHPHVIALFNQVFLISLLVFAYMRWNRLDQRGRWVVCGLTALSLGSMPFLNSWDVLIYAPVAVVFWAALWWKYHGDAWMPLAVVPPLSAALYLPWYFMLNTGGISGIGYVHTPSDPVQFLMVNGFFLAVLLCYCAPELRRHPYLLLAAAPFLAVGHAAAAIPALLIACIFSLRRLRVPDLLAICGLGILLITEFVYLRDNMGEAYYRMNTVFKFYLPAWILLGSASFVIIARWLDRGLDSLETVTEWSYQLLKVAGVILLILSPFLLNINFGYSGGTLDGLAYLEGAHPGDAAAVAFLRDFDADAVIVEAEGGDYKYYSRISSFTGIPTVIGMPFHEVMWRGNDARVDERMADVRRMYENPALTADLMRKYGATLLYLGASERERYNINIPSDSLELIYGQDGVEIYRLI